MCGTKNEHVGPPWRRAHSESDQENINTERNRERESSRAHIGDLCLNGLLMSHLLSPLPTTTDVLISAAANEDVFSLKCILDSNNTERADGGDKRSQSLADTRDQARDTSPFGSENGRLEIVSILFLEHGADANVTYRYSTGLCLTPLHCAARNG